MTETIEQITARATAEAGGLAYKFGWSFVRECGYRDGVIAEATRDKWIRVEHGLFLAPYGTTDTVLTYCKRDGIKQRVSYVGQWPNYVTHYQPLTTPPSK